MKKLIFCCMLVSLFCLSTCKPVDPPKPVPIVPHKIAPNVQQKISIFEGCELWDVVRKRLTTEPTKTVVCLGLTGAFLLLTLIKLFTIRGG